MSSARRTWSSSPSCIELFAFKPLDLGLEQAGAGCGCNRHPGRGCAGKRMVEMMLAGRPDSAWSAPTSAAHAAVRYAGGRRPGPANFPVRQRGLLAHAKSSPRNKATCGVRHQRVRLTRPSSWAWSAPREPASGTGAPVRGAAGPRPLRNRSPGVHRRRTVPDHVDRAMPLLRCAELAGRVGCCAGFRVRSPTLPRPGRRAARPGGRRINKPLAPGGDSLSNRGDEAVLVPIPDDGLVVKVSGQRSVWTGCARPSASGRRWAWAPSSMGTALGPAEPWTGRMLKRQSALDDLATVCDRSLTHTLRSSGRTAGRYCGPPGCGTASRGGPATTTTRPHSARQPSTPGPGPSKHGTGACRQRRCCCACHPRADAAARGAQAARARPTGLHQPRSPGWRPKLLHQPPPGQKLGPVNSD